MTNVNTQNTPDIDVEIKRLQLQKLRYEMWSAWRDATLQTPLWAPLIGLGTVLTIWGSGLLDVKRERLAIEAANLDAERQSLTDSNKQIRQELDRTKTALRAVTDEKSAIVNLKALKRLSASVQSLGDGDSRAILIDCQPFLGVDGSGKTASPNEDLAQALTLVKQIGSIHTLTLKNADINSSEAKLLGGIPGVIGLTLEAVRLPSEYGASMSGMHQLRGLTMKRCDVEVVNSWQGIPRLDSLFVQDMSFDDNTLKAFTSIKGSLKSLTLMQTSITDAGVEYATKAFSQLESIMVVLSPVTPQCLALLKRVPTLRSVMMGIDQLTDDQARQFKRDMPHLTNCMLGSAKIGFVD